jgi:hypothetical protein
MEQPRREDLVELATAARVTGPDDGDLVDTGSDTRLLDRWPFWARADQVQRCLFGLSVGLLVMAGGLGVAAAQARHPVHRVVHTVAARPGVDAMGCPLTTQCGVRAATAMSAELHSLAASWRVDYAVETYSLSNGTVYRRELSAHDPAAPTSTVLVISACVPGGSGTGSDLTATDGEPGVGEETTTTRMTPVVNGCFGYAVLRELSVDSGDAYDGPVGAFNLLNLVSLPGVVVSR